MKGMETTVEQEQDITNRSMDGWSSGTDVHNFNTPGGARIQVKTGTIPEHKQVAGRPYDPKFMQRLNMIYRRHKATGIPVATVLNLLPYKLSVNSPLPSLKTVINAAPLPGTGTDEFSFHVFEGTEIITIDDGDDANSPWDMMPRQLADAYSAEYAQWGGVVVIDDFPTKAALADPEVAEAIDRAKEAMFITLHRIVNEGMAEWMRSGEAGRKNVTEIHHAAGRYLHAAGQLEELPAFMLKIRTAAEVAKKCPVCTTVPSNGQSVCACRYVLDPKAAYQAGVIDEEDPSLERLTREQVEELGISDYVAECADEKPTRLKAGQPKPMSNMRYQQAVAAQQQEAVVTGQQPPAL